MMDRTSYAPEPGEKATQVMVGTPDLLIWGDLVTKEQVRLSGFLNTLAEDFVPLYDAKALFLAPTQQVAPVDKAVIYVKLEEILFFYTMAELEPLPEESEVRRYEPVEFFIGSYRIEGSILKSPIATLLNLLLVTKDLYMPVYQAKISHVAKPWLGIFSASMLQLRRDRLLVVES
jgi:hypothetical protein